jgi:hypothetical protein
MAGKLLTAADLLLGSQALHEVTIPPTVLTPGCEEEREAPPACVRLRPLSVGILTLISRAARDDASLVPLLMIKEAMLEPALTLDQIRQMHVGLVYYLVSQINHISGLDANGAALDGAVDTPLGRTHILLARHFGWTPEQVSHLTPGQVAVYLAGIERLLQLEKGNA